MCASECQLRHKSPVIQFLSHLYCTLLEYDVTDKTKQKTPQSKCVLKGQVIMWCHFQDIRLNLSCCFYCNTTTCNFLLFNLICTFLKPSLGTVQQVIYIVQVTERPGFMVNSSRVAWSDVWLWPIRLAGDRFMTETAISPPLPPPHTQIHTSFLELFFQTPHTMLFHPQ